MHCTTVRCRYDLLTKENVKNVQAGENGLVNIFVGIAFKFRLKSGQAPFVTPPSHGGWDKKRKETANKQAMRLQEQMGFDCVDVLAAGDGRAAVQQAAAGAAAAAVSKRVYWHPASVLPLGVVTLKHHSPCVICDEYFSNDGGFVCKRSKDHFVCWGCFDPYVQSASEAGN